MKIVELVMISVVFSATAVGADDSAGPAATSVTEAAVPVSAPGGDSGAPTTVVEPRSSACIGLACSDRVPARLGRGGDLMLTGFLSLQPMPIDFGNLYAGNWRTSIVLTGIEASLMTAGIVVLATNAAHMGRLEPTSTADLLSVRDRRFVLGLTGAYIATKLTSAWIAIGAVAEKYSDPSVSLSPLAGPGFGGVELTFSMR